jgi:hypothetical protein
VLFAAKSDVEKRVSNMPFVRATSGTTREAAAPDWFISFPSTA